MSIMMLYLVTIATHWLEFFSSNYKTNEEQQITFSLDGGSEEGGGEDCGIHP